MMYVLMEDFEIEIKDITTTRIKVPQFCLIGATTEFGTLSAPMRDRFGIIGSIGSYSEENMAAIVERNVIRFRKSIQVSEALSLAKRSRGTPRTAIRLVSLCNDICDINESTVISRDILEQAMKILGVDELGLTNDDRKYLQVLFLNFGGGPAGIDALSLAANIDSTTIAEVIEPHLLRNQLISREPKGRMMTSIAYNHLGIKISPAM